MPVFPLLHNIRLGVIDSFNFIPLRWIKIIFKICVLINTRLYIISYLLATCISFPLRVTFLIISPFSIYTDHWFLADIYMFWILTFYYVENFFLFILVTYNHANNYQYYGTLILNYLLLYWGFINLFLSIYWAFSLCLINVALKEGTDHLSFVKIFCISHS